MRATIYSLGLLLLIAVSFACNKAEPQAAKSTGSTASAATQTDKVDEQTLRADDVPVPLVQATRSDLLFSFVDARGEVRAVSNMNEVPASVRERVLVTDLSMTPAQRQAHRFAFFVDLRKAAADGSYPVTTVSRYNAARGEGLNVILPPAEKGAVIVYSAEWCGFCKKAKRWLSQKNVPFIERDVERQAGASKELSAKLAAAGIRGGGVPVIDWGGEIVMGFDVGKMTQLYERSSGSADKSGAPTP